MEELSIKKIEGRSYRENGGAIRKTAKQGINSSALPYSSSSPGSCRWAPTAPREGSGEVAGGTAGGYRCRCGDTGGSIRQGEQERWFLTGAASGGHLRSSRTALSFVSCPAPYSSPPGGPSSVPRWLFRGTVGDGGSGCASFREPAELLPLQASRLVFAASPSISSALGSTPTFSMPQDHPDAPSAARVTNTGQCGSSLPPLPFLPAYRRC